MPTPTMTETEQWIVAQQEAEVSRRTDDIAFNVKYLAAHVVDREAGVFELEAEADIAEQNITEVSESDIHKYGATVRQKYNAASDQWTSLGAGTIDHAFTGIDSLDPDDPKSFFELERRVEEAVDEVRDQDAGRRAGMQAGKIGMFVSPSPTHHETDPDVAGSFGYDDRTMLRFKSLTPDGQTKIMKSFSLFDAPAKACAAYISEKYDADIEPTAIAVMRFFNELNLQDGTIEELLVEFVQGVKKHVSEEAADNLDRQLDAFLNEQEELENQGKFYAAEKTAFQKELALSLNGIASPTIKRKLESVYGNLTEECQNEVAKRYYGDEILVDDYIVELMLKLNTVTVANRAGLATLNERTVKQVASKMGLEMVVALAETERAIQEAARLGISDEFMVSRSEQLIAEAGLNCGGGCSVSVVDLFSSGASEARKAGMKGKLYESSELDKNSKCSCTKKNKKAKVVVDEKKNALCITCGDYKVSGIFGNLKDKKKAA